MTCLLCGTHHAEIHREPSDVLRATAVARASARWSVAIDPDSLPLDAARAIDRELHARN